MMYQNRDLQQIYQERFDKFLSIIKKWQNQQHNKINQKSKDQQEYQHNKIVREYREKYDEDFTKQQKNIEVDAKIKKSRKTNQMRLSKMKLRFEIIEKVQNQVVERLLRVSEDQGRYVKLLEDLLMQGMTKMLEPKVEVKCLKKDQAIVKKAMERAQLLFSNICQVKTELILSSDYLPVDEIGGIMLTSNFGKIVCNNTLKARLNYAVQLSLPEVREQLFAKTHQN